MHERARVPLAGSPLAEAVLPFLGPATSLSMWEVNYLLTKLAVSEVMTRSVITIGPDREARDAAQVMLEHKIGALPVVDHGRLIGILTETDLLRAFVKIADDTALLRSR